MPVIKIKFGQYKDGYSWSNATTRPGSTRLHLVKAEPYNNTAVCGKGTYGTIGHTSGTLCPDCARILNIKSADDLDVDQEEYDWMEAQHDE
jgi:hypothetical protein